MTKTQALVAGVITLVAALLWALITDPPEWETDLGTVILTCAGIVLIAIGAAKAVAK